MKIVLELKDVTKNIRGRTIIDHLSFSIREGEVFGFLGPNGAGKTTTIRMMVGLMKLSKGDVLICGQSLRKSMQRRLSILGLLSRIQSCINF